MSRISKLPWIFHPAWGVCIKCSEPGRDGSNKTIAVCYDNAEISRGEAYANGTLMTAAPQLLEACENAYTHIAIARHFDETSGEADVQILQELEQAIRAAGGRVIDHTGKEVK